MRGFSTLWQPGYDHAGIATQNVVERDAREGGAHAPRPRPREVPRADVGVARALRRDIYGQFRRLGASLDYRRERFTMDDAYVRAVLKYFVHLHERGFLYRDNRIVNWCPRCASAISDLEVEPHGRGRHPLHDPVSARGRVGPPHDRDGAAADDAGRRRRGRASRRRPLPRARRARRRSSRSPSGACRSSPTTASTRSSGPVRSRSRRATTRWTSRSGARTGFRSSRSSASTG